jgi:enoyl-[acyl-carrier protein] reductase III
MLEPLKGMWCLILGASSGMGRATALAMADAGAHVIGVHFDTGERAESVRELVDELRRAGVDAHFFNVNAARSRTRAELVPCIAELTGGEGVRVLLHSLAFGSLTSYLPREGNGQTLSQAQLEMTLDVMANSLVYWAQDLLAADLLPRGSKIFAMTSSGSTEVMPSYGAVSAAKCALESHVRQLACELAPFGVAVNALRAGVTLTPALRAIPEHQAFIEHARTTNPHGRLTLPEDVGEAIVLLSQSTSSWITGNTINVDGAEHIAGSTAWNPRAAAGADERAGSDASSPHATASASGNGNRG